MTTRLLTPPEAQQALGVGDTKFWADQRSGLVPKPTKPGRGGRYPEDEIKTIKRAQDAGMSVAKLRQLVRTLERQRRINATAAQLAATAAPRESPEKAALGVWQ